MRKPVQVVLGIAFPLALVAGAYVVAQREYGFPEVDRNVKAEVAPIIQRHLESEYLKTDMMEPADGRGVCDVRFVETREQGGDLLVGTHTACQEYFRRGKALKQGHGFSGPLLVVLRTVGGERRVVRVQKPEDGAGFGASVRKMFSRAGAREVLDLEGRETHNEEYLHRKAREIFDLPADAPVENP